MPQVYHRWDYYDYKERWKALSVADKWSWRQVGSTAGITGFNAWMRAGLNTLTDLDLRLRMDNIIGATTPDSSKNAIDNTVYGATLIDGVIDKALNFDGIDDRIIIPVVPPLIDYTQKSVFLFMKAPTMTPGLHFIYYGGFSHVPYGDRIFLDGTNSAINLELRNPAGGIQGMQYVISQDTWYHIGYTWDGTTIHYYRDGVDVGLPDAFAGPLACSGSDHHIGRYYTLYPFKGQIDHLEVYRRALTPAEVLTHSERRYPLQ